MALFNREEFEELRKKALRGKYGYIPDSVDTKLTLQTEIIDFLEETARDKGTIALIREAIREKQGKGVLLRLCSNYPNFNTDKYFTWSFQRYDVRQPALCIPFQGKPWPGKVLSKLEIATFYDLAKQIVESTLYESPLVKEAVDVYVVIRCPNGETRYISNERKEVPVSLTNVKDSLI